MNSSPYNRVLFPLEHASEQVDPSGKTERQWIEETFAEDVAAARLSPGWKVVYRVDPVEMPGFLCTTWAFHRLKDDLAPGERVPKDEGTPDSTSWTVAKFIEMLTDSYKLVECAVDDNARTVIVWSKFNHPQAPTSHIQVKYDDNWESKMSAAPWVITHGENDFAQQNQVKVAVMKPNPALAKDAEESDIPQMGGKKSKGGKTEIKKTGGKK
ncbi:hypothetical protein CERSUDRAFT_121811 [Gelatoporia subvermispora B]|uniref:Uncharacterized protein n=1 Tax=Ceriporiopsis subvermispora (strain B) TaxID=914234 RepID=M2RM70_CERS8|nr:hypothetical protein CERSUDRAFT_121811 [Gelatoporia subvermispora B]